MCTNIIKAVKSRSDVINNQIHVINNSNNCYNNNNKKRSIKTLRKKQRLKTMRIHGMYGGWRAGPRIIGVPGEK